MTPLRPLAYGASDLPSAPRRGASAAAQGFAMKKISPVVLSFLALAALAALALSACESGGDMMILDLEPKKGHTQGEQPVRIIGKNFRQDIGYTIYFGNKKAPQIALRNPETIDVTTPTGMSPGTVDISVRADDGNAFKIVQAFTFEEMQQAAPSQEKKGNLAF